jgi:hypothetical protein
MSVATGVVVTTSTSPPSSPPSLSIEQYRARSSSFGSITPTFSSDLAKLRAACCGTIGDGVDTHASNTATTTGGVNNEPYVVHSYTKAIAIATTFDIFGPNSPLCQKLKLNTTNNKQRTTTVEENENGDENKKVWIEFINQSGAVIVGDNNQSSDDDDNTGSNDNNSNTNNNNDVSVAIQMEKLLRYCFDVAFKLPPNGHVRTVSSGRNIYLITTRSSHTVKDRDGICLFFKSW